MADRERDQPTTASKFKKKRKEDVQPSIKANEVRIKGNTGHVKRYVEYALGLLEGKRFRTEQEAKESGESATKVNEEEVPQKFEKFDTIVLKATGRAINKAVTTAEVVKRRVSGLHQVTSLETLEITDLWEPKESGLNEVETKRRVASITITLSRDKNVDKTAAGYQPPLSEDGHISMGNNNRRGRGGYNRGGKGGGGRGNNRNNNPNNYGGNNNRNQNNYGGNNRNKNRNQNRNQGGYNNNQRGERRSNNNYNNQNRNNQRGGNNRFRQGNGGGGYGGNGGGQYGGGNGGGQYGGGYGGGNRSPRGRGRGGRPRGGNNIRGGGYQSNRNRYNDRY